MTAPSGIRSGVGFRHVVLFALNAAGLPDADDEVTPYVGLQISGARTLALEDPEPRQINHLGDDNLFATDILPPTESMSGTLTVGKINDVVDALLTGQKTHLPGTKGEIRLFGLGTDKKGSEAQVGLMAWRQSLDTDPASALYGQRLWELRIMPKAILVPQTAGFDENAEEKTYQVTPMFVTSHIWGKAFTELAEGYTRGQVIRGISQNPPKIISWLGDGIVVAFNFPADAQAAAITKVSIFVDGVEDTTATITTADITFVAAPAADAVIVVFYETE